MPVILAYVYLCENRCGRCVMLFVGLAAWIVDFEGFLDFAFDGVVRGITCLIARTFSKK